MAASIKVERLKQVILFKVTQVLQRDISDPRMGMITITRVELKKDLSACTLHYSVLGDAGDRSRCQHALEDSCAFIQSQVAGALKTRVTPRLTFKFDPSIEGSIRISELLRKDREESGSADATDTTDATDVSEPDDSTES